MSYKTLKALEQEARTAFNEFGSIQLKAKDRLAIPLQDMPAQNPVDRRSNINEVALGYTNTQARVEALRCMQCKTAPCVKGCPVAIDIPGFIEKIAVGDYRTSVDIIKRTSLLPSICGRVCPQENQCQKYCTLGKSLKDPEKAVAIGRLERFVADWERENDVVKMPQTAAATGMKVAIIGAGPAGLTAAVDLRKAGHDVEIFEAFHKAGGVMVYGIPEFRLPKIIVDQEIEGLRKMGVAFHFNFLIGRTRKLKDLLKEDGFSAVFIGSGAGLPRFMGIEGEDLVGVFSANEYLTRANLMKAYAKGSADTPIYHSEKVAVLGGGNVAMDAARTAIRLGASEVNVIYRRTEKEMPARLEEIHHAKEEGIHFYFLKNVKRIIGNSEGHVCEIECLNYELGEPDDSGRRKPIPIEGSEHTIPMDTVIPALGNSANPLISMTTPELELNKWGNIVADEETMKTSMEGVWAGGDIVSGAATVIEAMGAGRIAAASINEYLAEKR